MKKYLLSFAVLLMGSSLLTGCLGSDDDNNHVDYVVTKGVLVINNGNYYNGIDGSLTFVDFSKNPFSVQQNVYKNANKESLGGTPNDVLAYGDKIYIVGSDENTVFVLNAKDFKLIEKINTVQEMGEDAGVTPRALEAYKNKVYVSTYGGYVAVIDTGLVTTPPYYETMIKVGSAPEGMAIGGTSDSDVSLYVANSDYGNGQNASISKINLSSGSVSTITSDKIHNPQELAVAGDVIYVLDWGYYDENWMQKEAGVYKISGSIVTKVIPDATGMAASGQVIYTYNYPYGSAEPTFSAYNVAYSTLISFKLSGGDPIVSPSAISVDPNKGYLYVASRKMDPDTGYPAYSLPGFVNIYSVNDLGSGVANFVDTGTFATGVEPHVITFTYGIAKLQY